MMSRSPEPQKKGKHAQQRTLRGSTVLVVFLFFVLNQCLSLLNRWALGVQGFRFPIMLTMCQALFFFLQVLVGSLFSSRMRDIVSRSYREVVGIRSVDALQKIVWVGLWTSANIVLNNVSLVYITLTLNQIIRSSIPVVTAIVSSVHDGVLPSMAELVGLVILCSGVIMVVGHAQTHIGDDGTFGIIMCFMGVISGAYMLYTTSKTLAGADKSGTSPSSLQVSFQVAPVTFLILSPGFYIFEYHTLVSYVKENPYVSIWIVMSASMVASLYNVVHTELVGHVGPVTTTVLGQVKIVSLMILSVLMLGENTSYSVSMIFGCVLSFIGFSLYGWARMYSKPQNAVTGRKKIL